MGRAPQLPSQGSSVPKLSNYPGSSQESLTSENPRPRKSCCKLGHLQRKKRACMHTASHTCLGNHLCTGCGPQVGREAPRTDSRQAYRSMLSAGGWFSLALSSTLLGRSRGGGWEVFMPRSERVHFLLRASLPAQLVGMQHPGGGAWE